MFRRRTTRPRRLFCVPSCRSGAHLTQGGAGAMAKNNGKANEPRSEAEAEGEGADGAEGKAAPGKRKLSLKLIIMTFAGLVGLAAIGGGGYYFMFAGHGKAETAAVPEGSPVKPV